MFEFRPLTPEAIPRALAKAERYRLLNEPEEAESICEDILRVDPDNHEAIITLLLALTDGFHPGASGNLNRARELLPRMNDAYERTYYEGIICERWAKAQHRAHRSSPFVHNGIREAMRFYEKAEEISPPGNDDAVLRWNACARYLEKNEHLKPEDVSSEAGFGDEVPPK